jgi:hypothetical protein
MNVARINATIIYNYNNKIKIKHKKFLKELVLDLIKDNLQTDKKIPNFQEVYVQVYDNTVKLKKHHPQYRNKTKISTNSKTM